MDLPSEDAPESIRALLGGDVVQRVHGANGQRSGAILWESKRTKHWSDQWLVKVREDQRSAGAEVAVIVSVPARAIRALPNGTVKSSRSGTSKLRP